MTLAPNLPPSSANDSREQSRTHLFVVAILCSGTASASVHIRNLSPSGALIEGCILPEPGTKIALRRGSLQTTGRVAWKLGRRAGISFDATAYVADWMSGQGNPAQCRADDFISNYRAGADRGAGDKPQADLPSPGSMRAELTLVRADLVSLGNALVGDAILVATHPEIQALDVSLQRIDKILLQLKESGDTRP